MIKKYPVFCLVCPIHKAAYKQKMLLKHFFLSEHKQDTTRRLYI